MPDTQHPSEPGAPLILQLAARVAEARKARKLSRRVLSELSGVSPRYLAQLEAGEGNISILLLARVANALDLPVEALLADRGPLSADTLRVASLYEATSDATRARVRGLLAPENPALLRAGRICLIGLRGAGKSTLGKLAGEALGVPFVELGDVIEAQADMPLAEVMALYGLDGYRRMEADALAQVSAEHDRVILAVAGGIVAETDTYARLLAEFHTVWIRTSPPEHMQRVRAQGDVRPMQGQPAAMSQLNALLEERRPLYARAEAKIDTSNRSKSSSLKDLLNIIAVRGFLDAR
ncbi:helix-turn-helix transcriptional regulator [Sulfitobacter aestuariivivens]|uniref:Shikimate kinase n=1 Tax=Sulfitobacter aestuariivivens TaxID=2766981 RepID=A0A927D3W2_9RHOB|nr:helix-turn-helix transcriptional regulator [Sulfitobacter aestuariivivens]MBD3664680.1 helix-turn-helix transcriptional regulator [Sulfitobacter aestuariivivens]